MIIDIFSTFDPKTSSSLIPIISISLILSIWLFYNLRISAFPILTRSSASKLSPLELIFTQLIRTNSSLLKGLPLIVSSLFILIIFTNLSGIIPYVFSLSRHLIITLRIGLPLWLRLIISSFRSSPKSSTAHFLPDGAPDWLNPFLVLIETTRVLVRPITLSFRLAANITAGHIVLSLVSIYIAASFFSGPISLTLFTLFNSFYISFELAICLIQAYIFCLLISLYRDDHS